MANPYKISDFARYIGPEPDFIINYGDGPPSLTAVNGLLYLDITNKHLFAGVGSSWYFIALALYTPVGGGWQFNLAANSAHVFLTWE